MSKFYKILLAVVLVGSTALTATAQDYWAATAKGSVTATDKAVARQSYPKEFRLFSLNLAPLRQELMSIVDNPTGRTAIITLPNADGKMEQFEVNEASNFEPALQARFPEIRAFSGRGITDRYASLKISLSPQGVQTMVFRVDGKPSEYMEPYSQDHTVYSVFKSQREKGASPWVCSTPDQQLATDLTNRVGESNFVESNTGELKTMRLAQSCNGEYANFFGATSSAQVALVLAAYNATLTRCNGCYEKDLAIHLNLIASTDLVIYYNPATDPYTTLANWNAQLQNALTTNIGEANYDIGHMFGASGGGGNAGCIGCVCVNGSKGSGITSPADGIPQGDNFDIDYVVHEVGHQMGANHTFSHSTTENTGNNKEVGSGITIMGYAGITNQDVAPHSIDIFHETSIQQIQVNMATKLCPITTIITPNNATPVVAPLTPFVIPISTPFALTGSATDANAGDALTYCWEQNDNSTTSGNASVASPTKTTGPNFLSFSPTSSPTRMFPRLSTILAGLNVTPTLPGGDAVANIEALSSVGRTLNFRLTVRDNCPYVATTKVGQTAFQDVLITVNAAGGPFTVTQPNTALTWNAGSSQTVTWDVNGTNVAPFNATNVKISYSSDGGNTFPIVLAASTPNDGTEVLVMPATATTTARIKIEAIGNIFFDISNTNFTLAVPPAGFTFSSPAPVVSSCPTPATLSTTLTATYVGGHTNPINLTATVAPSGTATLTPATLTTTTTSTTVTLNNTNTLSPGTYTVTVTGTSAGATTQTRDIQFTITPSAPVVTAHPQPVTVCTPNTATFSVTATGATTYQWQVSTDNGANWTNIPSATGTSYTTPATTVAMNGNQYRVVVSSLCGSVNSNAALLTVVAPATITQQPANLTICNGGNTSFTVAATTTSGTLTYQWQFSTDGGTTWTNIPGATTTTYGQTGVNTTENGYRFRVVVSSGCGSINSNAAILTVNAYPTIAFDVQATICITDPALTLFATPLGGTFTGTGVTGNVFTPSVAGLGAKVITYAASNAGCASSVAKTILVAPCPERDRRLPDYTAVYVYPVPNFGDFSIRMNTQLYTKLSIRIYNSLGVNVYSAEKTGIGFGSIIPVHLYNMPAGTYFVHLSNDEKGEVHEKGVKITIYK